MRKLYSYQKNMVAYLQNTPKAALYAEMRLGKCITTIRALKDIPGRKLIICPKSVIHTWCDELDAEGVQDYLWFSSEFLKRIYAQLLQAIPNWVIVNYEAVTRLHEEWKSYFQHIIVDECFKKGTLVDTPNGPTPIEYLDVGDTVHNAVGVSKILGVSIKKFNVWMKITYNNQIIECSLNHPFFTEKGWTYAKDLKKGDKLIETTYIQEKMSMVQKNVYSTQNKAPFLWKILFSEMENESAGNSESGLYPRTHRKIQKKNYRVVEAGHAQSKTCKKTVSGNGKMGAYARNTQESVHNASSYALETRNSRWKWQEYPYSPKQTLEIIRKDVETGIRCADKTSISRVSDLLQNRHSLSFQKNRNRSRRINAPSVQNKKKRQEKNQVVKTFRVENIEIYKSTSNGTGGKGNKENLFYDLKVEKHPSFSVNGALVHNSVAIKNPKAKITKFLLSNFENAERKILLSGNPAPNTPLEYFTQMKFLYGSWLHCDNYWQFRKRYFTSDLQGWQWWTRHSSKEVIKKELQQSCYFLSRKDVGVANTKVYEKRLVEMPPNVKREYQRMEKEFVAYLPKGGKLEIKHVVSQLLYLQEIASGHIKNQEISQFKIKELVNLLEGELKGEQVLIWCRFRWEIEAILKALEKFEKKPLWVHGEVPLELRKEAQESFNRKSTQILVLQIQTSRYGLNLSAGSTSIYFSNDWSYDSRSQSEARIESNTKTEPLLYVDLITKDSVEEDILKSLQEKHKDAQFFMSVIERIKARV